MTLTASDVADYLRDHPEFFELHAEQIAQMVIPHPHGGRAISITERQMITLRDRTKKLEAKLGELIEFGEENDIISEKLHRLAVALVAASTLPSVLEVIRFYLCGEFAVPSIGLRLWSLPPMTTPLPDFARRADDLQVYGDRMESPVCGSTEGIELERWFGHQRSAEEAPLRSLAMVPLRTAGGSIGMLSMASPDVHRFFAEMGTLYIERLGELIAAAIVRTLSPMAQAQASESSSTGAASNIASNIISLVPPSAASPQSSPAPSIDSPIEPGVESGVDASQAGVVDERPSP